MYLLAWKSNGFAELGRDCVYVGDISDDRIVEDKNWRLGITVEKSGDDYYRLKPNGSRNTHIPCEMYYFDDTLPENYQLASDIRNSKRKKSQPTEPGKLGRSRFQLIGGQLDDRNGWTEYIPEE